MATIKKSITLQHRANLGEEPQEVELQEGEEVVVLKEWTDRYLCKNDAGQLFNILKEYIEA
jgi:hypothetical protein